METPCRSLAGMTSSLLGKQLPKNPGIRLSRWSGASLNDDQVIFKGCGARGFFFGCLIGCDMLCCVWLATLLSAHVMFSSRLLLWLHDATVAGAVRLPGCLRVCSRLSGDRKTAGSYSLPSSNGVTTRNRGGWMHFTETFFFFSAQITATDQRSYSVNLHHERHVPVRVPLLPVFLDYARYGSTATTMPAVLVLGQCWAMNPLRTPCLVGA